MKSYAEALRSQYAVAAHRIAYSKENEKPCKCPDCVEHFEAIERGPDAPKE
jgi:hypothetical protein